MKELPDEKTLLELLEMAKEADRQARETCEIVTKIAYKWQKRLEKRQAIENKVEF